jgi:hypothetical protein
MVSEHLTHERLLPANLFLSQNHTLDQKTTLYTVFFGINDYSASKTDGDHMPEAAQTVLNLISQLASPPTNARSFLVADDYGRGSVAPQGEAYKQQIFDGLREMRKNSHQFRYGYVDFKYIWNSVLGSTPGYEAFGYTSDGACTQNSSSLADLASPLHSYFDYYLNSFLAVLRARYNILLDPRASLQRDASDHGGLREAGDGQVLDPGQAPCQHS